MEINASRFGVEGFVILGFGAQGFGFHLRNKGHEVEKGASRVGLDLGNKSLETENGLASLRV